LNTRIQVLSLTKKEGVGKKSGAFYSMVICQCVVLGAEIQVGELVLPKDHPPIVPGIYDAEFGVQVGQDKRISGQLVQLRPISGGSDSAPAPAEASSKASGSAKSA
jgi:hypothetical protein